MRVRAEGRSQRGQHLGDQLLVPGVGHQHRAALAWGRGWIHGHVQTPASVRTRHGVHGWRCRWARRLWGHGHVGRPEPTRAQEGIQVGFGRRLGAPDVQPVRLEGPLWTHGDVADRILQDRERLAPGWRRAGGLGGPLRIRVESGPGADGLVSEGQHARGRSLHHGGGGGGAESLTHNGPEPVGGRGQLTDRRLVSWTLLHDGAGDGTMDPNTEEEEEGGKV